MARIPGIRRLFRLPSSEGRVRGDVEREITFHVDERTQELIAAGVDPSAARAAALREFGDVRAATTELERIGRARVRHLRRSDWWGDLRQDLRYGMRSLFHAPIFSLLAIVTLALGIGANAAVFGVVKSVLIDSLPYADPHRLVRVFGRMLDGTMERAPLSAGTVEEIAQRQRSFESVAAYIDRTLDAVFGGEESPRIVRIAWIEPQFFETLGVATARGRTFHQGDAVSGLVPLSGGQLSPDTARAVVVTDAAWHRLLSGDHGVLGREVRINGIPRTVIGVLPPGFIGPMGGADFYFAFDRGPVAADPIAARRSQWLGLVGRLKPDVSRDAAERELAAIAADLARAYPADNGSFGVVAIALRDAMVGNTRAPLLVLMASAGLVLLIACANLAGALFSRSLSRRKEFAVRVALGAGRGRLVRQLLTESTLVALAGGTAGILLAALVLSMVQGLAQRTLPEHAVLALDGGAALVTALLTLCTGMAFGAAPALSVTRSNAQETLRDETRGVSENRRTRSLRGALVAGQLALCVSLLAGAGLLARSLWAMTTAPLGFEPDGVLTAAVQVPLRDYQDPHARAQFYDQFTDRLRTLPGVNAVARSTSVPTAVLSRTSFTISGAPAKDAEPFVLSATVSDDYFETLRIPLRQGRTFDARDRPGAPPTVVISESMARRYWSGGGALGAQLRMGPDVKSPLVEVVGIVGDVRNDLARSEAEPMAYRSSRQISPPFASFLLRTESDPLALVRPAERELAALNPGLALQRTMTLRALVGEGLAARRFPVLLMTAFGVLALLLASVGVYAMFDGMAATREREFGIRMALGSRPSAIAALVLRQGAWCMAAGLAGGALGILLIVRLVRNLLYEVQPFDPIAIGSAVALLGGCATVALLIPLRRATRVDPATTLRAQ